MLVRILVKFHRYYIFGMTRRKECLDNEHMNVYH